MASRHPLWMACLMLIGASGHEGCSFLQQTVKTSSKLAGGLSTERAWYTTVSQASCILAPGNASQKKTTTGNLSFIHIPRNAGTTIESCSKTAPESERWSHENPTLSGRRDHNVTQCYMQHVPPSLEPDFYKGKETFCVVRDPYERAISQLGFVAIFFPQNHKCNASSLNSYLRERFKNYAANPYKDDCHLLPQTAYVYGWDRRKRAVDREGPRSCDIVLRYETLDRDFNRTMEERGLPYRLSWKSINVLTESAHDCHRLTHKDLDDDVRQLVEQTWKEDFDLLGYQRFAL
mmetsp:Transcript_99416/g.264238  ORF Transcript_99416/g.264238 Transcript_99416/m.264238 type:complete len:291 (-) Transcript_99416:51-923(-)